jgi:AcrR family transcriptional regulator
MATVREKYADNTRQTLLDAGLKLFVERGYGEVSAEELVRAAGLTRGALYHHFDGKRGLFEAIFNDLEQQAARRIELALGSVSNPLERVEQGVEAFLDICTEVNYQQITMVQGPVALGWERWRELDQQHLGRIVLESVQELRAANLIKAHPADLIANALFGMLAELCAAIATAPDPQRVRTDAASLARDVIFGLANRHD